MSNVLNILFWRSRLSYRQHRVQGLHQEMCTYLKFRSSQGPSAFFFLFLEATSITNSNTCGLHRHLFSSIVLFPSILVISNWINVVFKGIFPWFRGLYLQYLLGFWKETGFGLSNARMLFKEIVAWYDITVQVWYHKKFGVSIVSFIQL